MDITKETASRVTAAMEATGETVLGLSGKTHIPRTTLIRRLAGKSPFYVDELHAIADALGVSVTDLMAVRESA